MLIQETLQQIVTTFGQDRFGVELHAFHRQGLVADPMISPSSVQAVISGSPAGFLRSMAREMVAGAGEGLGRLLKTPTSR